MKLGAALTIIFLAGCTPVKTKVVTYQDDGSQQQKKCLFECQNAEIECKQLAELKLQNNLNKDKYFNELNYSFKKDDDEKCEKNTRRCFTEICNGKVNISYE